MGPPIGKLNYFFIICWGFIFLVQCSPVDVIYTGDGCECPSYLNYQVNLPKIPKPKPCPPAEYGYTIDVPVQAKAKVSYSFDFTVEEPKLPKPEKLPALDLYAKIDRIAIKKADCKDNYSPLPTPTCTCGQCSYSKPIYGYVTRKSLPCKCQGTFCKCNLNLQNSLNSVGKTRIIGPTTQSTTIRNKRRRRDLQRAFLRSRNLNRNSRSGRFIKKYSKSLPGNQNGLFATDDFFDPQSKKSKTKHKKIVKRDIKGEYDLLEKEREQVDLTLPEIIQFMPEVLQKNFKRGQCHFGCSICQKQQYNAKDQSESADNSAADVEETQKPEDLDGTQQKQRPTDNQEFENYSQNKITTTFNKRSAANYNYGNFPRFTALTPSAFAQQSAYDAQSVLQLSTNPILATFAPQKNAYSAFQSAAAQTSQAYSENTDRIRFATQVSDSLSSIPLQYAGDLDAPFLESERVENGHTYPVEHISSGQLDHIIADIIYRHPAFVDASTHYGGVLVDPEPLQAEQTKEFLKKLLEGRLRLSFEDDEEPGPYFSTHKNLFISQPPQGYNF